jgi:hypothetical protein
VNVKNSQEAIDSPLIPEWMQAKRQQDDLAIAREGERIQARLAASLLIERERTTFWKNLIQNLKIAVDALPILKMAGSVSPVGLDAIRIQVSKPGIFANFTHTDLFLDAAGVRCHMMEGGYYEFQFSVISESAIGLTDSRSPRPLNSEQISERIMRRMVELIEGRQQM